MKEAQESTTRLTITAEFTTGHVETLAHEWPGWNVDVAVSVLRAQSHVSGGKTIYELPRDERLRVAAILRVTHEWTDRDRAAEGAAS